MEDTAKFNLVKAGRDKAFVAARFLRENKLDDFGSLLHEAWVDKKAVETSISNEYFDDVYNRAREAGALGGKLLGAGGGGFFIFYTPEGTKEKVSNAILDGTSCKIYDFKFTERGSSVASHC
jgi:D-glycero-alpha-D-manno-heptose-7-phosphate kinase